MVHGSGSQSSHTSADSDEEEISGIDYSRVIDSPKLVESAPDSSSTPRKGFNSQTQQTQNVQPLTASQLKALMEDDEANETRETVDAFQDGHSEHILSSSASEGEGEERDQVIDLKRRQEDEEEEIIHSSPQFLNQIRFQGQPSSNAGNHSLEIIEETPLKVLSMVPPQTPYVYILVKWQKNWWPARADRREYELKLEKSRVLFRNDEVGDVDLSKPNYVYNLREGNIVHIVHKSNKSRFKVIKTGTSPFFEGKVTTNDGQNLIKVQNLDTSGEEFAVDAEDIYLSAKDIQQWQENDIQQRNQIQDTPVNDRRKSAGRGSAGSGNSSNTVSPRKRREIAEIPREPSSPEFTRVTSQEYALQSSPATSPTKRVKRPVKYSTRNLFSNCIFSISISDSQVMKARARDSLVYHGAKVLDDGLSEIVTLTDSSKDGSMPDHDCHFGMAKFAAVLADAPRRTSKYLEMVALGWPCLSLSYMYDCIDSGKMIDWRPYLLPAGESNLIGKKMIISADTSAFYTKWLRGATLTEQFLTRKVVFRCSVPICITGSVESFKSRLVLLASLCTPRFKLWFYVNKREVPDGSILLDLKPTSSSKEVKRTDPILLDQLIHYASAELTVVKNTEWLIQCIINGGMV